MSRTARRAVAVIAVAITCVATLGGPARAEPVARSFRVTAEMVRVGVDHKIAEANGYEVRVDSKGVEYSVPKGSPWGLDNEVPGPCGSSFVEWININFWEHRATIYTGFDIREDWAKAVAVPTWQTVVTDSFGVSTREHGPPLDVIAPTHHWDGKMLGFRASGPTGAWVDLTVGWAVLASGTICWTLSPFDFTEL